jgi:hypothetical protein
MKWIYFLIILLNLPLQAATVKGEVISIQKVNFVTQSAPHLQFILRTEQGEYAIQAGSEWYLEYQGVRLFTGETVEVEGPIEEIEGKKIIRAERLTINETVIILK